jgi:ParB-like chromosome segregation protein Spo0J
MASRFVRREAISIMTTDPLAKYRAPPPAEVAAANPVARVLWVPIERVFANNYNPNSVALMEMQLLYVSVKHDGYTQPVVTIYDEARDRFIIVDGFHRYSIMKRYPDMLARNHGLLPVVVIAKSINDRMASTIRHNRARGKHSIDGMSSLVVEMLNNGWGDQRVCEELGLEKQELIRLKHITGYAKFFAGGGYSPAMETNRQIAERLKYDGEAATEDDAG